MHVSFEHSNYISWPLLAGYRNNPSLTLLLHPYTENLIIIPKPFSPLLLILLNSLCPSDWFLMCVIIIGNLLDVGN